jgi:hypothetical protein
MLFIMYNLFLFKPQKKKKKKKKNLHLHSQMTDQFVMFTDTEKNLRCILLIYQALSFSLLSLNFILST